MSIAKSLSSLFKSSEEIPFDDTSKFILFSDCHRGDNSWADEFANNQNVFFHALNHYYDKGFTYIELGDGDELWENASFEDIREAHSHIFWKMTQFHEESRLYLLWGNHNRKWKRPVNVEKHLYQYHDERKQYQDERKKSLKPLFKGIKVHEGLILKHQDTGNKIFLAHGHQGDFLNDKFWWFGRFFVRNMWKPLQNFGVKDPTRPAKNFERRESIEKQINKWAKAQRQVIIVGHTHKPAFPTKDLPVYFNTGSCVHPRCITGIEIEKGEIALVKWFIDVRSDDIGTLFINRQILEGPMKLQRKT